MSEIKSSLFRSFPLGNSPKAISLQADLRGLLNQKDEVLEIVYGEYCNPRIENNRDILIQVLQEKTSLDVVSLKSLLRIIGFFIYAGKAKDTENDSPKDWVADLLTEGLVESKDSTKLLKIVSYINEDVSKLNENVACLRRAESGVLPNFTSIETTVELRAVNKNSFSITDNISEYLPDIIDVAGVVSVNLSVSRSVNENVCFQATPNEIRHLINELESALMDIEALEKYVNKENCG